MKKQSEKLPIDDLFARKLGNMSLPPSADAFGRLQARINQQKPEVRLVFWHNPSVQWSIATAACLFVVCLFGWQYWSANGVKVGERVAVTNPSANSTPVSRKIVHQAAGQHKSRENITGTETVPLVSQDLPDSKISSHQLAMRQATNQKPTQRSTTKTAFMNSRPAITTNGTTDKISKEIMTADGQSKGITLAKEPVVEVKAVDQVTQISPKQAPTGERVLVVTITEPVALVAARTDVNVAADPKPLLITTGREELRANTKIGNLWQQVKRVKAGDVFASRTKTNDERGLLDRAYTELKQTLDKDKSLK